MSRGIYNDMDFSALTSVYEFSPAAPSGWGTDYASYLFSRMPDDLYANIKSVYTNESNFSSVADAFNPFLTSLSYRDRAKVLDCFYKAGNNKQQICWTGAARDHFGFYSDGYAALADYLVDPQSLRQNPAKPERFEDLLFFGNLAPKAHCTGPMDEEYLILTQWINDQSEKGLGFLIPTLSTFRTYTDKAASAWLHAIHCAAREHYTSTENQLCSRSSRVSRHCRPGNFYEFLMLIQFLIGRKSPFCLIPEKGLDGKEGYIWVDVF